MFGVPPNGAYLLSYWRGEWFEYYASWSQESTLVLDPTEYYIGRNRFLEAGLHIAMGAVLLVGASLLFYSVRDRGMPAVAQKLR